MPPQSVIVEIHMGTTANKNSYNLAHHIGSEHIKFNGSPHVSRDSLIFSPDAAWKALKQGIDRWYELGDPKTDSEDSSSIISVNVPNKHST